ncbi:MAG: hypothetical protein WDW38_000112 [Sanguina aurantia]
MEWLVTLLLRTQPDSHPKKGPQSGSSSAAGHTTPAPVSARGNPQVWDLLGRLLSSGRCRPGASIPTSLLAAAADACSSTQVASPPAGIASDTASLAAVQLQQQQLVAAVTGVVVPLLNGSCVGSAFRPTLEQLVSLVTVLAQHCAVLSGEGDSRARCGGQHAGDSQGSGMVTDRDAAQLHRLKHALVWSRLTQAATDSLAGVVQDHPSPKKVFQATATLAFLSPVLCIGFPFQPLDPVLDLILSHGSASASARYSSLDSSTDESPLSAAAAASSEARSCLAASVQRLLQLLLFHESHVPGIAQVCQSLCCTDLQTATGKGTEAADASQPAPVATEEVSPVQSAVGPEEAGGKVASVGTGSTAVKATTKRASKAAPDGAAAAAAAAGDAGRSYHGQLFQALKQALKLASSSDGAQCCTSVVSAMPWLLHTYGTVVTRHRKLAAQEAAAIGLARGSRRTPSATAAGTIDGGAPSADTEAAASKSSSAATLPTAGAVGMLPGAEFCMFAVLSDTLLDAARQSGTAHSHAAQSGNSLAQQPGVSESQASAEPAVQGRAAKRRKGAKCPDAVMPASQQSGQASTAQLPVHEAVAGLASLLAALQADGGYHPTRDFTGAHLRYLQNLSTSVLAIHARQSATPTPPDHLSPPKQPQTLHLASTSLHGSTLPVAASAALVCLMDVDHRAVSPQLDDLWRVLWEAHRGRGATPTTRARPTASARHRARSRTPDVAVAAAQRLVLAFSELRQLGSLLASLMASWREWEAAAAAAHPAGAASWLSGSSAPVAVLSSPALLEALCGAVALLPSGQLSSVVLFIHSDIQLWVQHAAATPLHPSTASAISQIYDSIMGSLRIDLTTATAAATAVQEMFRATLALPLAELLYDTCTQQTMPEHVRVGAPAMDHAAATARQNSMAVMLLRVYSSGVRLHATCAALHPEVTPLLDQDTRAVPRLGLAEPKEALAGSADGYFAAAMTYPLVSKSEKASQLSGECSRSGADALVVATECAWRVCSRQPAAPGASDVLSALFRCVHQRVKMLHEQLASCRNRCIPTRATGSDPRMSTTADTDAADRWATVQSAKEQEMRGLVAALLLPLTAPLSPEGQPQQQPHDLSQTQLACLSAQPPWDGIHVSDTPVSMWVGWWEEAVGSVTFWAAHADPDSWVAFLRMVLASCDGSSSSSSSNGHTSQSPVAASGSSGGGSGDGSGNAPLRPATSALGQVQCVSHRFLSMLEFQCTSEVAAALPTALSRLLAQHAGALLTSLPHAGLAPCRAAGPHGPVDSGPGKDGSPSVLRHLAEIGCGGGAPKTSQVAAALTAQAESMSVWSESAAANAAESPPSEPQPLSLSQLKTPPLSRRPELHAPTPDSHIRSLHALLSQTCVLHLACFSPKHLAALGRRLSIVSAVLVELLHAATGPASTAPTGATRLLRTADTRGLEGCLVSVLQLWGRVAAVPGVAEAPRGVCAVSPECRWLVQAGRYLPHAMLRAAQCPGQAEAGRVEARQGRVRAALAATHAAAAALQALLAGQAGAGKAQAVETGIDTGGQAPNYWNANAWVDDTMP